jgi:hypothetical protein
MTKTSARRPKADKQLFTRWGPYVPLCSFPIGPGPGSRDLLERRLWRIGAAAHPRNGKLLAHAFSVSGVFPGVLRKGKYETVHFPKTWA